MADTPDGWIAGSTYESFMGRWSRQLAPVFVSWLEAPVAMHWLDVGCGTGALTAAICARAAPASVLGCDPAAPFVEFARQESAHERATFAVAGSGSLPRREGGYGYVSSLLALNFFPDHAVAVREMAGLVRHGGVVTACVWDYAGKMEFLRYFWDAAIGGDPDAEDQDEGSRFPVCDPRNLEQLFGEADLVDVRCDAIEIRTRFASFDDYWRPLLGGTGPAAAYVASLSERRRDQLADRLQRTLPRTGSGAIDLVARAWAVRGAAV